MTRRLLISLPLVAACAAAQAGPPWALQRAADGAVVTRTYAGTPYAIAGYRWLDIAGPTLPAVDSRIYARVPCSEIAADARIDHAEPGIVDCADSGGADELVVLADPLPPAGTAEIGGVLYTGLYQVDWQDTGEEPTQSIAALRSLAEQHRRACIVAAAYPQSCDDVGPLLARQAEGETLGAEDSALVATCAQASRACGSPNETNRARLEGMLREAYSTRGDPEPAAAPDLDMGWTSPALWP
jgi:hypothetical protein